MEVFVPRKTEKDVISVRISSDLLEQVEAKAVTFSVSRNEFINQCIVYALKHITYADKKTYNDEHSIYSYLKKKSTKELDAILNYVVHNYAYEPGEVVKTILGILEEREKDHKPEITPELRAAWERDLKKAEQLQNQQDI